MAFPSGFLWRRVRDLNPRYLKGTHDFQSCALDHSANSPSKWCFTILPKYRKIVKCFFAVLDFSAFLREKRLPHSAPALLPGDLTYAICGIFKKAPKRFAIIISVSSAPPVQSRLHPPLHSGTHLQLAHRDGRSAPAVKIRKPSHRSPVVSDCLYVRRPSAIGPAHKNRRDKHLRPLPRQNSCHSRPKPHRCLPAPPLQDEHSHRTSARWYSVLPPSRGTIGQTTRTKNLHTVLASMNILRGPAVPPRGQDME